MTLSHWCQQNGYNHDRLAITNDGGTSYQIFPGRTADVPALFHLSDYVVSSALSGPSYMLTPRTEPSV